MRRSTHRILVSHAGTLPRPAEIVALMQKGPDGEAELAQKLPAAVKDLVRRQVEVGVDIVNDGEIPKRGTFPGFFAAGPGGFGQARGTFGGASAQDLYCGQFLT
jgi:5-methyltetrahydropteroyltriglutamate--homocysteine methyltransferase